MKFQILSDIRSIADILPDWLWMRPLSKRERLERWAEALERAAGHRLATLFEIEYAPPDRRAAVRADNSPLSVAFEDMRLRAEGLSGDTVGDAVLFFGINEMELHNVLCYCHFGETMAAETAAMRVRHLAARSEPQS